MGALHLVSHLFGIDTALLAQSLSAGSAPGVTEAATVDAKGDTLQPHPSEQAAALQQWESSLRTQASEHHARLAGRRLTLAHALAQRPRAIVGPEPIRRALVVRDRCSLATEALEKAPPLVSDVVRLTSAAAAEAKAVSSSHQLSQRQANKFVNQLAAIVPIGLALLMPVLASMFELCRALPRVSEPQG
jgi:hypothetical protein